MAKIPKDQTVAVLNTLQPSGMTAAQKSRLKRLVSNPTTRHLLQDKFLSQSQRQQREMNTRLSAPVVPGSTVTQRDLSRQRDAAAALKYGPQEQQAAQNIAAAQRLQQDTGGWYDQYRQALAAHQANTSQIGTQTQQALQGWGNAIQGLDQSQVNQAMQSSAADAATRGAVVDPKAAAEMMQGSAVRQALLGSFGAMMAAQAGGANTYADTLSNVVAPGQKLTALAQTQGNINKGRQAAADLAREKGTFKQQFEDQFKTNEAKNVLEQQRLNVAAQVAGVNASATEAKTQKTKAETDFFNAHGYWPSTGKPKPSTAPGTTQMASAAAKYGYTLKEWQALSTGERQKVIKDFKASSGAKPGDKAKQDATDFYNKYGVKPAATAAVGRARDTIQSISSLVNELKASGNDRSSIARLLVQGGQVPTGEKDASGKAVTRTYSKTNPLWTTVALDLAFLHGGISNGTADRLHRAGYSARLLGLKPAAGSTQRSPRAEHLP